MRSENRILNTEVRIQNIEYRKWKMGKWKMEKWEMENGIFEIEKLKPEFGI